MTRPTGSTVTAQENSGRTVNEQTIGAGIHDVQFAGCIQRQSPRVIQAFGAKGAEESAIQNKDGHPMVVGVRHEHLLMVDHQVLGLAQQTRAALEEKGPLGMQNQQLAQSRVGHPGPAWHSVAASRSTH